MLAGQSAREPVVTNLPDTTYDGRVLQDPTILPKVHGGPFLRPEAVRQGVAAPVPLIAHGPLHRLRRRIDADPNAKISGGLLKVRRRSRRVDPYAFHPTPVINRPVVYAQDS